MLKTNKSAQIEATLKKNINKSQIVFLKKKYKNQIELSKHIWNLKERKFSYVI